MGLPVRQVQRVPPEQPDPPVLRVTPARLVLLVPQVEQAQRVELGRPAQVVLLGLPDLPDQPVRTELME